MITATPIMALQTYDEVNINNLFCVPKYYRLCADAIWRRMLFIYQQIRSSLPKPPIKIESCSRWYYETYAYLEMIIINGFYIELFYE